MNQRDPQPNPRAESATPSGTEPCLECERLKKEILRLKEELKIVVGICSSDTLPAKEK